MELFFNKYTHLESLGQLLKGGGVTEERFFCITNSDVNNLLGGSELFEEFVEKYNAEKSLEIHRCLGDKSMTVEEMDVDESDQSENNGSVLNTLPTSDSLELPSQIIVGEIFQFVENDLFNTLNNDFMGQLVLDKYKLNKDLDLARFKDVVVCEKIKQDEINYKIKKEWFQKVKDDAAVLFPTEDPDILYIPRVTEKGLETPTKGCLYNHYKIVRGELRLAGKLPKKPTAVIVQQTDTGNIADVFLKCLTDPKRELYTSLTVMTHWDESFDERCSILDKIERNIRLVNIETYFRSFPCLDNQLTVLLLHADFGTEIKRLIGKGLITKESDNLKYTSLFSDKWGVVADKIIANGIKCRNPTIKEFFAHYKTLHETGLHNKLLALLLLPLSIQTSHSITIGTRVESLTREEISKCFVLHVKEIANLDYEIAVHEEWLNEKRIEVLPFVVFVGALPCTQFYLVVNSVKYSYNTCTEAIEACYKCLTALRRLPGISDYVWSFIEKLVYDFSYKKSSSQWVTQYVSKIKKLVNAN